MGILRKIFGNSQEPEEFLVPDEESIPEEEEDYSTICRGCYSYGDGCCNYHAHWWQKRQRMAELGIHGW